MSAVVEISDAKLIEAYVELMQPMILHAATELVTKEEAKIVMSTKEIDGADFHLSVVVSIHDPSTVKIGQLVRGFEEVKAEE